MKKEYNLTYVLTDALNNIIFDMLKQEGIMIPSVRSNGKDIISLSFKCYHEITKSKIITVSVTIKQIND
jgi:hypothetical protein